MDYSFTANIEKEFDEIAGGRLVWNNMVREFYDPFHNGVEHTLETAVRAVGERQLGTDPESSKPVTAAWDGMAPWVQIGSVGDEETPLCQIEGQPEH